MHATRKIHAVDTTSSHTCIGENNGLILAANPWPLRNFVKLSIYLEKMQKKCDILAFQDIFVKPHCT